MQRFILFSIVTVTVIEFLANGDYYGRLHILPGAAGYLPELLGAFALLYVVAEGVRGRFQLVRSAYWLIFGALVVTAVCGIVVNDVEAGPIFAGLRTYLRAIPWFFVPAVFAFSEKQVRQQLKWLLAISLVQIPFAAEQRMTAYDVGWGGTGDSTTGTLGDSGILSIFLASVVCVVSAFYARGELKMGQYIWLFLLILAPTMINETKAMVVFLPAGVLVSFWFASHPGLRLKRLVGGIAVLALFAALFIPIYDQLISDREYAVSIGDFFSEEENIDRYMSSNKEVGSTGEVGRGDAITVPAKTIAKDPVTLVFGYGVGNASDSALGAGFSGKYARLWENFLITAFSRIILELGFLGFGLLLTLYWLIFKDSRALARGGRGPISIIGAGWTGVVVLVAIGTMYTKIEVFASLSFLFWYFSGLIAAERMRLLTINQSKTIGHELKIVH